MNDNASRSPVADVPSARAHAFRPTPLERQVLRAIFALTRAHRPVHRATVRAVVAVDAALVAGALEALLAAGLVSTGSDADDLRLMFRGLAVAVTPTAIAFERRRTPRLGVRKASRSVA